MRNLSFLRKQNPVRQLSRNATEIQTNFLSVSGKSTRRRVFVTISSSASNVLRKKRTDCSRSYASKRMVQLSELPNRPTPSRKAWVSTPNSEVSTEPLYAPTIELMTTSWTLSPSTLSRSLELIAKSKISTDLVNLIWPQAFRTATQPLLFAPRF